MKAPLTLVVTKALKPRGRAWSWGMQAAQGKLSEEFDLELGEAPNSLQEGPLPS